MLALFTLNLLGIGWIRDAMRMETYLQGCVQAAEPGSSAALEEVGVEVSPSHDMGAAAAAPSLPPVSPQPNASLVAASPPEAIQLTPSSVSHGGGHVRAGSGHVRVGSGSVTSGRSDGMDEDDADGEVSGGSNRRGASLDPHTLEWVQKLKAETSEAERRRQEELLASLSPEELEARQKEEKLEAERVERQKRLLKRQLMGYSALSRASPAGGSGRGRGGRHASSPAMLPPPPE